MIRSTIIAMAVLVTLSVGTAGAAEGAAIWRLEPALAPPPPPGVEPAPYPVPVGHVGAISFWAPNRGLLITGSGLYAYNGQNWHELATVCGGEEGRIAWAGPDDFWTISDQRPGQPLPPKETTSLQSISLCHFLNGQVVGSYAMPLDQQSSYLPMDAAACYGPEDCWFGGALGHSPNVGAFHLHWNGSTVSTVYGPEDHAVTGMVNFAGQLFESVGISSGDSFPPELSEAHPPIIHTIAPGEQTPIFSDEDIYGRIEPEEEQKPLPEYGGKSVPPWSLEGFTLTSDGSPLGAEAGQLWAVANSLNDSQYSSEPPVVMRGVAENPEFPSELTWSQLPPTITGRIVAAAAEPGSNAVWLSMKGSGNGASVARLEASGAARTESVPGPREPVGLRGSAGAIACPAPEDCWLATETVGSGNGLASVPGWLFHLTNGTQYPLDTDPNFAGVISYRPPDASIPVLVPIGQPEDDSLVNQITVRAPSVAQSETAGTPGASSGSARALVTHIKSKFLHRRTLTITFILTAKAHVQLLGRRKGKVVAKTRDELLRPGHHRLSLSLNPADWPTKLQFEATPVGGSTVTSAPVGEGSGEGEAGPEAGHANGANTVVTG
jgi:hypothetical protein